jgi:hypothetical protein
MDIGVLTVVSVVLAAVAVHAGWRAVQHWDDDGGRALRMWWTGALVVLAVVAVGFEVGHHQRQRLATEAMTVLTDNPDARANCERLTESLFNLSQYDGYVYRDNPDVALYRRHVCRNLASYAASNKRDPSLEQVAAVHLIAHETMHVEGVWVEAEAECRAVQLSHLVAEQLGATPAQARELQATYFAELYPLNRSDYISGECRAGGALDIFPDRTEFP